MGVACASCRVHTRNMGRTSIRPIAVSSQEVKSGRDAATSFSIADKVAELRLRMAAMDAAAPHRAVEDVAILPVSGPLSIVLPNGGLPRRAVTHTSDTPALVAEIIDQVVRADGQVGVVGWPELSYAGISASHLEHIIAVPEPGTEDLAVAGVLAEGLDLVVVRTRAAHTLTPVRARPLLARLRKGNAAFVIVNASVPSPALTVTGCITQFHGIGRGTGRIQGIEMNIRVRSQGSAPAASTIVLGTTPACLTYQEQAHSHLRAVT